MRVPYIVRGTIVQATESDWKHEDCIGKVESVDRENRIVFIRGMKRGCPYLWSSLIENLRVVSYEEVE